MSWICSSNSCSKARSLLLDASTCTCRLPANGQSASFTVHGSPSPGTAVSSRHADVTPLGQGLHFACTHAPQPGRHTGSTVDSMPGDGTCRSVAHNFQQTATAGIDSHAAKAAGHSWQDVAYPSAAPQGYSTSIGVHASKAAGQTWQVQGSQPVASQHASQTAGGRGHFGLGVCTESLAAMERAAKAQHRWAQITLQSEPEVQQNHGFLSSAIVMETLNRQRQAELLHLSHEGDSDLQASGLQEKEQPGRRTSPSRETAVASASESSSGLPSGSPTSNRCVMHAADVCAASSLLSHLLSSIVALQVCNSSLPCLYRTHYALQ